MKAGATIGTILGPGGALVGSIAGAVGGSLAGAITATNFVTPHAEAIADKAIRDGPSSLVDTQTLARYVPTSDSLPSTEQIYNLPSNVLNGAMGYFYSIPSNGDNKL